jgi:hypothetical protein
MFNAMIVAIMLGLVGYYGSTREDAGELAARTRQYGQAGEMAAYRQAVVAYFTANPGQFQSAPASSLMLANSPLAGANQGGFAHYRLPDGTILVYATAPQPGLMAELLALSHSSSLVGRFSGGLFRPALAPASGAASTIATPALAIPNGGPVWLAAIN